MSDHLGLNYKLIVITQRYANDLSIGQWPPSFRRLKHYGPLPILKTEGETRNTKM